MHAEDSTALGDSLGSPGRCVTLQSKSLNLRFCASQGMASSSTERQKAPWEASEQFHDCPTCWDFLMEARQHFSKLEQGLVVLPTLLPFANPNAHYLRLFMGIRLSSSVKIGDILLGFEVLNTQGLGQANSRRAEDPLRYHSSVTVLCSVRVSTEVLNSGHCHPVYLSISSPRL